MDQPSEITPRMFAVDFERPSGRLVFTVVLLALCPNHAIEQALWMFPGFHSTCPKGHVQEVAFVDIDWELRLAFVARRKRRPPMLLMDVYCREKWASRKRTVGGQA